ncbi:hypothetical protein CLTEP_14810 [Clostridium tepidiprofundi DSM 19306]|uniref:Uncharacterized protein n=1 Tax=Clostridium tepidiprofundi DSM 19306 TaxID=1121338 RepID=A0A151B427_9CLOT|nr:hypothetical protein [Clostridium tepidiprofundi]KYH34553.1 hypothetical protein CLTEP_14810 [Clostridium tepidiprofundi DSM 19306]
MKNSKKKIFIRIIMDVTILCSMSLIRDNYIQHVTETLMNNRTDIVTLTALIKRLDYHFRMVYYLALLAVVLLIIFETSIGRKKNG